MRNRPDRFRRARSNFRRPLVEPLEPRRFLSTSDGSFGVIGLTALRADPSFAGIDGHGIGIAILDTGVDAANPEIQPNFVHFYNAVTQQDSSPFDNVGHGTHVAGIAASSNPNIGVAYHAGIVGVKVLPDPGQSWPANYDPISGGLQWVETHYQDYNIKVVNMSLGDLSNTNTPQSRSSGVGHDIAVLEGLGITVVAASGNDFPDFGTPGAADIGAVATVDVANTWPVPEQFSSPIWSGAGGNPSYYGVEQTLSVDQLDVSSQRSTLPNQVAAPGSNIYSDWNGGASGAQLHQTDSGTSMSSPMLAGVVALMQQAAFTYGGRYLTPSEVILILHSTADKIVDNANYLGRIPVSAATSTGFDASQLTPLSSTGLTYDRVNAYHAVQAVRQLVGAPSPGTGSSSDTNDTINSAVDLASLDGTRSYTATGNIGSDGQVQVGLNDVDLYKVTLLSPGRLAVELGPVTGGAGFDSYLRVFDAQGNEIANDHGSAGNGFSQVATTALAAGVYYVGVSSFGNTGYNIVDGSGAANGQSQGDYTMTVALSNPDPNGVIAGAVPYGGLPILFRGSIGSDPPPPGSTTRVQIGPQDVDMFQVIAPDDGALLVDVNVGNYAGAGTAVADGVRVFDAQGNELASQASFGATDNAFHLPLAIGQVVYVAVSDEANMNYSANDPFSRSAPLASGGLYDLFLSFDNGDQNGTVYTAVPATIGQVIHSTIGSDPLPSGGRITVGHDGSKDVDFFKFTPGSDGLLDLKAVGDAGFTPVMSLWTGDAKANNIVKLADSSSTNSELIEPVVAGDTYYLAVTGLGNSNFLWYAPASGSGGETGDCTVTSSLRPTSDRAALSNDVASDAGVQDIAVGSRVQGNIGMDGSLVIGPTDVDLYRFQPTVSQTVVISTDTTADGSADTFLRFFDAQGRELAYNDNAGPATTGSLIQVPVTADQTYYIGVNGAGANPRGYDPITGSGASPGSQGNYVLSVSALPGINASGGLHLTAVAGAALANATVATYTDTSSPVLLANYSADIGWGDGGSSTGSIAFDPSSGVYTVTGSHTYAQAASDTITVTIHRPGAPDAVVTSTADVSPAGTPSERYVSSVYFDVLSRPADAGGLAYWSGQLDQGAPRGNVAALLVHGDEYYGTIIVAPAYSRFLGRAPDATGIAYWVDQMQHHGLTDEKLEAGFIGSAEFYQHAGATDKLWVDAMYLDLLGRAADQGGETFWTGQLARGALRSDVAYGFAASLERERQRVADDYMHYLGRLPDQGGIDYWANRFAQGETNEDLITGFVASDEYFAKHTS